MNQNVPFSFMKYKHHNIQSSNLNTGLDNVRHYSMALAIDIGITETLFLIQLSISTIVLDFATIRFNYPQTHVGTDRSPSSK